MLRWRVFWMCLAVSIVIVVEAGLARLQRGFELWKIVRGRSCEASWGVGCAASCAEP